MYWRGLRYGRLICTRPSSCPADILLPIREKDLTYRFDCIAIRFFEYSNRTYPNEALHKGETCNAPIFRQILRSAEALQFRHSPLSVSGRGWRGVYCASRPSPSPLRGGMSAGQGGVGVAGAVRKPLSIDKDGLYVESEIAPNFQIFYFKPLSICPCPFREGGGG